MPQWSKSFGVLCAGRRGIGRRRPTRDRRGRDVDRRKSWRRDHHRSRRCEDADETEDRCDDGGAAGTGTPQQTDGRAARRLMVHRTHRVVTVRARALGQLVDDSSPQDDRYSRKQPRLAREPDERNQPECATKAPHEYPQVRPGVAGCQIAVARQWSAMKPALVNWLVRM